MVSSDRERQLSAKRRKTERNMVDRSSSVIRLLIADDHPIVRDGLKSVVAQHHDIEIVGEAQDANELLTVCRTTRPDVLLLDVSMPGPGVTELIRRLRGEHGSLRILVLSVHPEQHYARRVLKAGADGYVTKNHTSDMLYSAIRQVHMGRKYVTPTMAEQLASEVAGNRECQPHETLSNREYEVLLQIGTGRTVDEIAKMLGVKPKTVRSYRSRIIEKTQLKTTAEIIFYAISSGLVSSVQVSDRPDNGGVGETPRRKSR